MTRLIRKFAKFVVAPSIVAALATAANADVWYHDAAAKVRGNAGVDRPVARAFGGYSYVYRAPTVVTTPRTTTMPAPEAVASTPTVRRSFSYNPTTRGTMTYGYRHAPSGWRADTKVLNRY